MKRFSLIIILVLVTSVAIFGVVVYNHGESAYEKKDNTKEATGTQIKTLIIFAGGHFLKSHAGFQEFLQKIELAELTGTDYNELQDILNGAIGEIESAKTTYYNLKNLAAATPYNQTVIDALAFFNYTGFLNENSLNSIIFCEVENLFKNGNVTGLYEDAYEMIVAISELLQPVKNDIDQSIFPDIALLWQVNQIYFNFYLKGQYASMIFKNL